MRRKMYAPRDRRMFSKYADRTKVINVRPVLTRGGFRL